MSLKKFFEGIRGRWSGDYSLWLQPERDPEESDASAEIQTLGDGKFLVFTYSWVRHRRSQEGVLLVGGTPQDVFATWVDTFHSANEPMLCEGNLEKKATKLVLDGHYQAGPAEWGWRTELTPTEETSLIMEAFNITPEGDEMLAVRAAFERAK